ncbi:molybdopterin-binding protein [Spiribacter roseus]|uniref:Molybdopterin-binding protein n=1 Tax=Spiribacter roseus TaxID=1855875 RepID=A0ABV3RWN5_9GAMM|nr:molybdopterin-binding protein [Spiribacter roseus]
MAESVQGFGLIVIGDELLSGKRRDKHFPHLVGLLADRGLELRWVRMISDEPALVTRTLEETFAGDDVVFSCGGIGATPDDRTRQCAAAALGRPLAFHPEGVAMLEARFGRPVEPSRRLHLVEFPEGASVIPNPVNQVPGFSVAGHHFMPGFPSMAWPMMEWVLDEHYGGWQDPDRLTEASIIVHDARESDVIPLLERFEGDYPELRLSCLPTLREDGYSLELGLRGAPAAVEAAMRALREAVEAMGFSVRPAPVSGGDGD